MLHFSVVVSSKKEQACQFACSCFFYLSFSQSQLSRLGIGYSCQGGGIIPGISQLFSSLLSSRLSSALLSDALSPDCLQEHPLLFLPVLFPVWPLPQLELPQPQLLPPQQFRSSNIIRQFIRKFLFLLCFMICRAVIFCSFFHLFPLPFH